MPARSIKSIDIRELQPTEELRPQTISFLENLSNEQILSLLGTPRIWQTPRGNLIEKGNNPLAVLAKRGIQDITVEYKGSKEAKPGYIDELAARAEVLRSQGIYSPHDLWQA